MNTASLNLEYKIGSGKIVGTWRKLDCTETQLQERAEIMLTALEKSKNRLRKDNYDRRKKELYHKATTPFWVKEQFAFNVGDGEKYFQWMRLLLDAGR